jgi:hypothetical protein
METPIACFIAREGDTLLKLRSNILGHKPARPYPALHLDYVNNSALPVSFSISFLRRLIAAAAAADQNTGLPV